MAQRGYIPIEKEELPMEFEIELAGIDYFMGVNHNESQDILSVDLWDINHKPIVLGERLLLNERLWQDVIDERLPSIDLIPLDESQSADKITYQNFMETVFIYIDDLPPDYDIPSLDLESEVAE